jgi:hypothetical protein
VLIQVEQTEAKVQLVVSTYLDQTDKDDGVDNAQSSASDWRHVKVLPPSTRGRGRLPLSHQVLSMLTLHNVWQRFG